MSSGTQTSARFIDPPHHVELRTTTTHLGETVNAQTPGDLRCNAYCRGNIPSIPTNARVVPICQILIYSFLYSIPYAIPYAILCANLAMGASIPGFNGTVVANFGAAAAVLRDNGSLHRAIPLKKLPLIVAGDRIYCKGESLSELRITELHPRSTVLERPDRKGQMKPLAANLSRLIIVSAFKPAPEPMLIDQFCVVAERADIEAIVVLNKSDLATQVELEEFSSLLQIYANIGYQTAVTHTKSDDGVASLAELIQNQTSVLVGQSGVGKSSIIQRLLPDMDIRIGAISEATGIGSHTTTVSFRYEFGDNGVLIDSPGVRQFQVEHLTSSQISVGYREITQLSHDCRFNNCKHFAEPSCAVKKALTNGSLSKLRYDNFIKLVNRES